MRNDSPESPKKEVMTCLLDMKTRQLTLSPILAAQLSIDTELSLETFCSFIAKKDVNKFLKSLEEPAFFMELSFKGTQKRLSLKAWGNLHQEHYHIAFQEFLDEVLSEKERANRQLASSENRYRQLYEQLENLNIVVKRIDQKSDGKFGQDYFASVVNEMTVAMDADYVFMGQVDADYKQCTTLYLSHRGEHQKNFSYDLRGTPCETVAGGDVCLFGENIQNLFPDDFLLQEMEIEAYAGVPINFAKRAEDEPEICILVALFKRKLDNPVFYSHVLEVISAKIETEVERSYLINDLKIKEERFRQLAENSTDIIYKINLKPQWHFDYISPAVTDVLGYPPEVFYQDRDFLFKIIHVDDLEIFKRIRTSRENSPIILKWIKKDGEIVWIEQKNVFIYDEEGRLSSIEGSARDISRRIKKQERLNLYSARLRAAEKLGGLGAWEWNLETNEVWWSDNHFRLLGEEVKAFKPTVEKFIEYVHPEDREFLQNAMKNTLESNNNFAEYFRIIDAKGKEKVLFAQSYIERDENGKAVRWSGIEMDMTDLFQKQRKLDEKKKLERILLDTMTEGVAIYNEELKPVVANKRAYEILQLSADQFYGRSLYDEDWVIVDSFENQITFEDIPVSRTFASKKSIEGYIMGVVKNATAEVIWIKVNTNLIQLHDEQGQLKDFVVVSYSDITEVIALERTESLYSTAISAMDEGLVIHDKNGQIINFNEAACQLLGLTENQLLGRDAVDPNWGCYRADGSLFPREEHPAMRSLKTGKSMHNVLMTVQKPNGDVVKISINASPIFFSEESETPDAAVATFTDITQTQAVVEELRALSFEYNSFKQTVFTYGDILVTDVNGVITKISENYSDILKYDPQELIGMHTRIFSSGLHSKAFIKELWKTVLRGEIWKGVFINKRKDGGIAWIDTTIIPIHDEQGQIKEFLSFRTDISEKKQNEIALKKTQEMLSETSEVAKVGGWEIDLITQKLFWSKVTYQIHEVSEDFEPDLESAINFYKEGESRERIMAAFQHTLKTGESFDLEAQIISQKGNELWIRTIGKAEINDGKAVRMYGTFQDISEKKSLELELKKANEAEFAKLYKKQKEFSDALEKKSEELNRFFNLSSDLILIEGWELP